MGRRFGVDVGGLYNFGHATKGLGEDFFAAFTRYG
jgi:hypothetical protein